MPNYRDFCAAFFSSQLSRVAARDETLRALPSGMRDAIARHLGVPPGLSQIASMKYNEPIGYVHLYRQYHQADGTIRHVPSDTNHGLYFEDGAYSFCIGVGPKVSRRAWRG